MQKLSFDAPINYKSFLSNSVSPGDDFYGYVCEKWEKDNPLPDTESRWGSFSILRKNALESIKGLCDELVGKQDTQLKPHEQHVKKYYQAALNVDQHLEEARKVFVDTLNKIDQVSSADELVKMFGNLGKLGVSAPFRMYVDADDKDSSQYVLRVIQGGLTLPEKDYYTDTKDKEMKKARDEMIVHIKRVHGAFPELCSDVTQFEQDILKIENMLADISRTSIALRDVEACYNPFNYESLEERFADYNWSLFFKALDWKPSGKIIINQPEFVDCVTKSLLEDIEPWKLYLKWQYAINYISTTSTVNAELNFEFFGKILGGSKKIKPIWRRALMLADGILGEDIGQLYVSKYFPEACKKEVEEIAESVRSAYGERIKRLSWMSDVTKQRALKKLGNIKLMIGYPDEWRDYSRLELTDIHIQNVMNGSVHELAHELSRLGTPVRRDIWSMTPHTVNAYCDFNLVNMVFPAGILQSPFYDPHATRAANYGGIGSVIGHELTHSFDDKGALFDEIGVLNTWMQEDESKAFKERTQIIIDRASEYEVLPGLNMKGELVVGEAIADLGGYEIAYEALMRELKQGNASGGELKQAAEEYFIFNTFCTCTVSSDEFRREMAISDPHPDDQYRINGIFTHMDSFYDTYDVSKDSKMYTEPSERARIW